jgi:hypothetical protein
MFVLLMEGIHKPCSEMGSGAMVYIPSFIMIGSGIQKLLGGIQVQTQIPSKVISQAYFHLFKIRQVG